MVNVIITFDVQTGKGTALSDWLDDSLSRRTRAHVGCHSAELLRDVDDPDGPVLVERWESADVHKSFVEQLVSAGTMNEAMAFLNGPPASRYYTAT
jgi:quinol monooxygenase YgiN